MFLLNKDEKVSFLKVIYSCNMFDRHIQEEEKKVLDVLQTEVFKLTGFQRIDLETTDRIAEEINKISKVIPVIYLFNIMYDLSKYYRRAAWHETVNNEKLRQEYKERIDSILEKVKYKDEVKKNKLFEHLSLQKVTNNDTKLEEDPSSSIQDGLYEGVEVAKVLLKNIFK